MSRTFSIVTLGCKTNQFESVAMSEQLLAAGYQQVDFNQGAELVIVNSCTVTAATDSQSRNLIRRAQRINPQAQVVVTGCYAQIDPARLEPLPGVVLVIGNQEKAKLLEYLARADQQRVVVSDIRQAQESVALPLSSFAGRSRAFVQIQNGCDSFCSYCIIPYARGRSRSLASGEILTQISQLQSAGYAEIVLTGIHIGQYGNDFTPRQDLLQLLQQIERDGFVARGGRLRLGSIEPTELTDELLHYIVTNRWICPHYHIPLQAGDDTILQRMKRPYDSAFYRQLLEKIVHLQPDAAIGLDLITGFPGETDAQFQQTCNFLHQLPFTHLHVFPYSRRPGTEAANLPGQLPGDLLKQRAALLRQIGAEKLTRYAHRFVGRTLEVIFEEGQRKDAPKGLSAEYLQVSVSTAVPASTLVDVVIERAEDGVLVGCPDDENSSPCSVSQNHLL